VVAAWVEVAALGAGWKDAGGADAGSGAEEGAGPAGDVLLLPCENMGGAGRSLLWRLERLLGAAAPRREVCLAPDKPPVTLSDVSSLGGHSER
jgi:hypothetical protein